MGALCNVGGHQNWEIVSGNSVLRLYEEAARLILRSHMKYDSNEEGPKGIL